MTHQDLGANIHSLGTLIWEFLSLDFQRRCQNFQAVGRDPRASQHFLRDSVRADADTYAAQIKDGMTRAIYQTAIAYWFKNFRPDFSTKD